LPEALDLQKELDIRQAKQSAKLAVVSKGDPQLLNSAAHDAPANTPAPRAVSKPVESTARTTAHKTRTHTAKTTSRKTEQHKTATTARHGVKTTAVGSTTIVSREIPPDPPRHKHKENTSSRSNTPNPSFRGSK
jgi:hypothetical protein